VLGLAASVLVVFGFMTQMHERYAYAALVFLALLVAEVPSRWVGLVFGVAFTLNLVAAVPATPGLGEAVPVAGPLGITGSLTILSLAGACIPRAASKDAAAVRRAPVDDR
jgi:hypothetical protein